MATKEDFSFGKRDLNAPNHWQPLDINTYKITKPVVLCFGGNGTIFPRNANSICKTAQRIVGIKDKSIENEIATNDDIDFIGFCYGEVTDKSEKKKKTSFLTDKEVSLISENLFSPLYKDENGYILSEKEIIKNFNKVNFVTHCRGASELRKILVNTYRNMLRSNIDKETASMALEQTFSLSYAPYELVGTPSLNIITMQDNTLPTGPDAIFPLVSNYYMKEVLDNDYKMKYGNAIYKEDEYNLSLITSNLTKPINFLEYKADNSIELKFNNEHQIDYLDRNEKWRSPSDIFKFGDAVSQVCGYTLSSAIANSLINYCNPSNFTPKPLLDELLEDSRSILSDTQNPKLYTKLKDIKNILEKQTIDIPESLLH